MVIEPRVVQFWFEIILVISNRTRAARSIDFEITHMISAQIALHSVQLPLSIEFMAIRQACTVFCLIAHYFFAVMQRVNQCTCI